LLKPKIKHVPPALQTTNRAPSSITEKPRPTIRTRYSPLALWHLLSLDAPTVAALWTWFIATANHVRIPLVGPLAMFLAVWILYAADRLLDAGLLVARPLDSGTLEARHHFHHRHRSGFLSGMLVASIALAILLPRLLPEAIRLYLILGALVFAYFILIHATQSAHRLPKELAVGICFAAATFIPTVAYRPDLRLPLIPSALLFAALCSLNCLFIYAWEHDPNASTGHPAHATTSLALRHLPALTITALAIGLALALLNHQAPWPIAAACTTSIALLLLLHYRHRNIPAITLRAAVDLALLAPILFLPFIK
jgi:hypothetical protein